MADQSALQKYPWLKWLLVLLVVIGLGVVLHFVLIWRELHSVALGVDIAFITLASLWCYYGLHLMRGRVWFGTMRAYLIASNVIWLSAFLASITDRHALASNLMGIWLLIAIGVLGAWLIRLLVSWGHPVAGVARTVILQATRLHIVNVVIAAVVVMIIALPGALDPQERINYRVTFYLTWSLSLAAFLLSIMTAILGCYTITYDLTRRQMFMLASKPLGRFQYLLGKWLGLVLLTGVLCAIIGVGVWLGARVLAAEPPREPVTQDKIRDRIMVESDVLAARVTAYPVPARENELQEIVKGEFEVLKKQFPSAFPEKLEDVDDQTLTEIRGKAIARWHTIEPGRYRTYVFEGFKPLADGFANWAGKRQALMQEYESLTKERREDEAQAVRQRIETLPAPMDSLRLRIKPKYSSSPPDGMLRLAMQISGQSPPLAPMPDDTVREIPIPLSLVEPDGRVVVSIANINQQNPATTHQANITFDPYEDIEMIYSEGTFEGNVVRAMLVHWVRLWFLAMLSIAAGTFLGFPMACLTSVLVYGIAVFSSFASASVAAYGTFSVKGLSKWDLFMTILANLWQGLINFDLGSIGKLGITLIGNIVLLIVPSFGYYNSTPLLADGRMVTLELVMDTVINVGLVGTGACMLLGWLLFRRKELARVTV